MDAHTAARGRLTTPRHLPPLLAYAAITVALTWPLTTSPGRFVPSDLGDPLLTASILWWNAQQLPFTSPWWNGTFFFPGTDSLAPAGNSAGFIRGCRRGAALGAVAGVEMTLGPHAGAYARHVVVEVSEDGHQWRGVAAADGAAAALEAALRDPKRVPVTIRFEPRRASQVRVRQTGRSKAHWAVVELRVLARVE